jgi:phosphatidylglycerol:prolipoprotein diacylglycerol transferase
MMLSALWLLVIEIGIDPEIGEFGGLLLTWHGVFTAIGIAVGVYAAVLVGRRQGFIDDDIYSAALIAIPFGIIGARALFVIENWGESGLESWVDIFRINEGGISIYGAVIGGLIGGIGYAWFRKLPILRGLDVAAVGIMVGMGIGRIGDLINGEHFAESSGLPWAIRYTHVNSPSVLAHPQCGLGQQFGVPIEELCAQHPAVGYEMIGDFLILGVVLLIIRFVGRPGVAFFTMMLLYALMRFGVSELRLDSEEVFAGLTVPQVTALSVIPFALIGLVWCWLRGESQRPLTAAIAPSATSPPASADRPAG